MSEELLKNNINSFVPESLKEKMFLSVNDIKDILQLGQTLAYEYLNSEDLPFKVVRINSKILIHSHSFWKWYFEE